MSTEQGGTATWHSTITCPEDGEALNENALVTELAIPIIDRTKYLYDQGLAYAPWGRFRAVITAGGTLSILRDFGVASIAYSGASAALITLDTAMPDTNYGGTVTGWFGSAVTPVVGTIEVVSTTQFKVRLFDPATNAIQDLAVGGTYEWTVMLRG